MVVCRVCGKDFSRRFNLDRHLRAMHSGTSKNHEGEDEFQEGNGWSDNNENEGNRGESNESTTKEEEDDEMSNSDENESDGDESNNSSTKEEDEVDVWRWIDLEAIKYDGGDVCLTVKFLLTMGRALRRDPSIKKVMKAVKKAMDEDDMDYDEALEHVVEKRKFLILRAWNSWKSQQHSQ